MKKALITTSVLLLAGCTVKVADTRLPREEVIAAFQQRDIAIAQLAKAVEELRAEKEPKEK